MTMSGDALAPPEPKEIDETRSMDLRHLSASEVAYIRVRVTDVPRPDGSVLVYVPEGLASS